MESFSTTGVPPLGIEIVTQPRSLEEVEPEQSRSLSVQATGTGNLQYRWCKGKEDDPASQESAQQQVFREHTGEFKQLVDASNLYQPLFQDRLITSEQVSDLILEVPGNTNPRKVDNLLTWLPKSSNFLKKLILCLRKTDHSGHQELADSYEKALWPPLSPQNLLYDGVNNSTLQLCSVQKHHEGVYRCRVSNSTGSVLSEPASVSLIGSDEVAVRVFVTRLQEHPEKRAETAQSFINKLQPGSVVGYAALSAAIIECGDCKEVVRAFLANGWTSDKPTEDGRTLVHVLADRGCSEALQLALQDGGENSVRATDKNRCTPLHLAVGAGHVRAVQILLDAESLSSKKSLDYQDKDFNTALHLAVGSDNQDMVHALLERSVNLGIQDGDHKTALEVAKERGKDVRIIRMLEDKERNLLTRQSTTNGHAASPLDARGYRANSLDSSIEQRRETGESHGATSGYGSVGDTASLQHHRSMLNVRTADRPMMELQKQLSDYRGTLTGKKLLKSGVLRKCTRRGALDDRMIYLLTDVMLHTKNNPLTGKYSVRDEMSVRGMKVQDPDPPAVRNEPLSFTVTTKQRGLSLVARTPEEKKEWIRTLQSAIDDLSAGHQLAALPEAVGVGARAPVWVPDNHVTACQICNKKFSFLERKHHCRQCGKVICGACSPGKRYLSYLKRDERVCKECKEGSSGLYSPGCESTGGEQSDPLEMSAGTVMSGYAKKLQGGGGGRGEQRWYQLGEDDVLYIYGAHEDTMALQRIPLKMGYTLHGDRGSSKIVLSHNTGREDLNETFIVPVESYLRWHEVLKKRT